MTDKRITICVCSYGDNFHITNRCIGSILANFDRKLYKLKVGCNNCSDKTINYLRNVNIDKIIISEKNLYKPGIMACLFDDIDTDYIFWFDDDSYVLNNCLEWLIDFADKSADNEAIFGTIAKYHNLVEIEREIGVENWIKQQTWYRNKPHPSREFKYEENMDGFYFIRGGNYLLKTKVAKELNWPNDPTGMLFKQYGEDIILCEALHQNSYKCVNLGINYGIAVDDYKSRLRQKDLK
jgi:GT2 family glycosyltransferase